MAGGEEFHWTSSFQFFGPFNAQNVLTVRFLTEFGAPRGNDEDIEPIKMLIKYFEVCSARDCLSPIASNENLKNNQAARTQRAADLESRGNGAKN